MGIRQGVILVITHDDIRFALLDHSPGNGHCQANSRATINQITEENHFATRVAIDAVALVVTQFFQ